MIKIKDFYVSDSDYEEQMELFQNEYPNAEFIQITGGHMSPERIWFKYDDKLKEQPKLSIPKKIAEIFEKYDEREFESFGEEEFWIEENGLTKWIYDSESNQLMTAYLNPLTRPFVEVTDE